MLYTTLLSYFYFVITWQDLLTFGSVIVKKERKEKEIEKEKEKKKLMTSTWWEKKWDKAIKVLCITFLILKCIQTTGGKSTNQSIYT
jgi:hypothetical protein